METKRFYGVFSDKAIAKIVAEELRMEKLDAQRGIELNRIANGCCPRHGERIHYGMHDAVCGGCEYESDTGESVFAYKARLRAQMDARRAEEAARPVVAADPNDILF
jgi:hypothetical protein